MRARLPRVFRHEVGHARRAPRRRLSGRARVRRAARRLHSPHPRRDDAVVPRRVLTPLEQLVAQRLGRRHVRRRRHVDRQPEPPLQRDHVQRRAQPELARARDGLQPRARQRLRHADEPRALAQRHLHAAPLAVEPRRARHQLHTLRKIGGAQPNPSGGVRAARP